MSFTFSLDGGSRSAAPRLLHRLQQADRRPGPRRHSHQMRRSRRRADRNPLPAEVLLPLHQPPVPLGFHVSTVLQSSVPQAVRSALRLERSLRRLQARNPRETRPRRLSVFVPRLGARGQVSSPRGERSRGGSGGAARREASGEPRAAIFAVVFGSTGSNAGRRRVALVAEEAQGGLCAGEGGEFPRFGGVVRANQRVGGDAIGETAAERAVRNGDRGGSADPDKREERSEERSGGRSGERCERQWFSTFSERYRAVLCKVVALLERHKWG